MEERRLNIEAPLLSVRRSTTSPSLAEGKRKTLEKRQTLPYPKSDLTLYQLEPITIPFNWEHIPGRSKGKEPPITPTPWLNEEPKDEKRASNGDDDDVYSDALDTMSPSTSFFMNCSESGISGLELDDLNANSGTFNTDQKTRDFMMNRFLPAAKAVTLQTPQYASRKQTVAVEQLREVNRSVREEKKLLLKKRISDIIQNSSQCQAGEESGDEGDDYPNSANVSAKGCGLLPQLRIKNSLCLLNPLPGMKLRSQVPMPSSAYEVGKPNKGSHVRSYSPAPAVKKAIDAIYKNKSSSEAAVPDIREARKKWMSQSCRFTGESQQQGRLSPFRRSRAAAAGVSPCRSRPQYPLRGARLLCDSREAESISQSNRLDFQTRAHGNIQENGSAFEKTLYIDSASTVRLSSPSHSSSLESSQDVKQLQALEEMNLLDSNTNNTKEIVIANDDSGNGGLGSVLCPLPPPLPKSPSESWLWRALPLVSVRNPLHHSNVGTYSQSKRKDSYTTSSNNTKWQTIVKTSNLQDDHVRYSQELIATHIPQRLKS